MIYVFIYAFGVVFFGIATYMYFSIKDKTQGKNYDTDANLFMGLNLSLFWPFVVPVCIILLPVLWVVDKAIEEIAETINNKKHKDEHE